MFDSQVMPPDLKPGDSFVYGPNKATYVVNPDRSIALKGSKDDKTAPPPEFDDWVSIHKNDKLVINGVLVIFRTAVHIRVPWGFKRVIKVPDGPGGALIEVCDIQRTGVENPDGSNFTISKPPLEETTDGSNRSPSN